MADFIKLVDVDVPGSAPLSDPGSEAPDEDDGCKFEPAKTTKQPEKTEKPKTYKGPYPVKALNRIREAFIRGIFESDGSIVTGGSDRMVEILKLKLQVKSRLDGNETALRQIASETAKFKEQIDFRMDYLEKRLGNRKEVARYFNAVSSSSMSGTGRWETPKSKAPESSRSAAANNGNDAAGTDESTIKTLPFFISTKDVNATNRNASSKRVSNEETEFKTEKGSPGNEIVINDSDSDDDASSKDDQDDEDVQFLEEIHSYFKETDKVLEDFKDSSDSDSRCYQFSMYKYDPKNRENSGKIVSRIPKEVNKKSTSGEVTQIDDDLEEKTKLYRQLRNKRNKELKKSKGKGRDDHEDGEKRDLADGIRKIRRQIRTLRRKRNKKLFNKHNSKRTNSGV